MGFFSKDIKTMNDLFMHGLEDLFYAENQIAKSLPDMIEKATNSAAARRLREASQGDRETDSPAAAGVQDAGRRSDGFGS